MLSTFVLSDSFEPTADRFAMDISYCTSCSSNSSVSEDVDLMSSSSDCGDDDGMFSFETVYFGHNASDLDETDNDDDDEEETFNFSTDNGIQHFSDNLAISSKHFDSLPKWIPPTVPPQISVFLPQFEMHNKMHTRLTVPPGLVDILCYPTIATMFTPASSLHGTTESDSYIQFPRLKIRNPREAFIDHDLSNFARSILPEHMDFIIMSGSWPLKSNYSNDNATTTTTTTINRRIFSFKLHFKPKRRLRRLGCTEGCIVITVHENEPPSFIPTLRGGKLWKPGKWIVSWSSEEVGKLIPDPSLFQSDIFPNKTITTAGQQITDWSELNQVVLGKHPVLKLDDKSAISFCKTQ